MNFQSHGAAQINRSGSSNLERERPRSAQRYCASSADFTVHVLSIVDASPLLWISQVGEISIRGPTVFAGYDNAVDMNAEVRFSVDHCLLSSPFPKIERWLFLRPFPKMAFFAVVTWATRTRRNSCTSVVDPRSDFNWPNKSFNPYECALMC